VINSSARRRTTIFSFHGVISTVTLFARVARPIHVAATQNGDVIRQELQLEMTVSTGAIRGGLAGTANLVMTATLLRSPLPSLVIAMMRPPGLSLLAC